MVGRHRRWRRRVVACDKSIQAVNDGLRVGQQARELGATNRLPHTHAPQQAADGRERVGRRAPPGHAHGQVGSVGDVGELV